MTCSVSSGQLSSCTPSGGALYKHSATLQTSQSSGGCAQWNYGPCGWATVTVQTNSSGVPTSASIVNPGFGLTSSVVFTVNALGGDGATATATESGGTMNVPVLGSGGDGYQDSGTLDWYALGGGCTPYASYGGTPFAGYGTVATSAAGSATGTMTVTHNATGCTSSPTIIFGDYACNTGTIGSPVWGQCSNKTPLYPLVMPIQVMLTPGVSFEGNGAGSDVGPTIYSGWDQVSVDANQWAVFGGALAYEDIGGFTFGGGSTFLDMLVTNNANYGSIHDITFNSAWGLYTWATDLNFTVSNLNFNGYASWVNGGSWCNRQDVVYECGGYFDMPLIQSVTTRFGGGYPDSGGVDVALDNFFANNWWHPEFTGASTDFLETAKFPQTLNQRQTSHTLASNTNSANTMTYRGITGAGMFLYERNSRTTGVGIWNVLTMKGGFRYIFCCDWGGMTITNMGLESGTPITGTNDPYRNATAQEGAIVTLDSGSSAQSHDHATISGVFNQTSSNLNRCIWSITGGGNPVNANINRNLCFDVTNAQPITWPNYTTSCSGQPTGQIANVSGVVTICP